MREVLLFDKWGFIVGKGVKVCLELCTKMDNKVTRERWIKVLQEGGEAGVMGMTSNMIEGQGQIIYISHNLHRVAI